MADKNIKVKIDVDVNAEPSIAQLKLLKKELKNTAAGSEEFKKLYNEIDDLEDKIKSAKGVSKDWVDTLEGAGGPLGALGAGLNKVKVATQSWGAALKATGIGLVVALIAGLVGAFKDQEGAMKKLEPLLIAFQKLFNGIFRAVEPLFNQLVDLALKVMPYVTQAFGVAYSAITSFLQGLGKLGSAIGKLIKGDFTGAWDDAKSSVTDFGKRYDEANKNFISGTKEVTKIEKDELEKRRKANEEAAQKKKEADAKAAAEAKRKAEELKKLNDDANKAELDAFKETLSERERQEYEAGIKLAERRKALADAGRTDMTGIEAAYRADLAVIKKKYDDEDAKKAEEKAKKDKEDLLKKQEEERGILLTGLQAQFEDLDRKNKQSDLDFEQDLVRLKEQKEILASEEAIELQNTELTEFQKTEIRKKYADARMAITTQEIDTEKAAAAAKHEINMAYLGLFEQFGNLLGQVAGKNKALAIAGIVISQAASIGQIIANTAVANAKSVAALPLTFGQPWVTINTISAALSIASTVAAAAKSISSINSAASAAGISGGGGGGAVGGASVTMPTPPKASGAAAPTINTSGGQTANSQLAETIGAATGKPVRAFVVSGDVTTQQALDRRTNRAATFSTSVGG
jgi:hypothetical protein